MQEIKLIPALINSEIKLILFSVISLSTVVFYKVNYFFQMTDTQQYNG